MTPAKSTKSPKEKQKENQRASCRDRAQTRSQRKENRVLNFMSEWRQDRKKQARVKSNQIERYLQIEEAKLNLKLSQKRASED